MTIYPGDKITNGTVTLTILALGISLLPGMESCFVEFKHSHDATGVFTQNIEGFIAQVVRGKFTKVEEKGEQ